MSSIRPQNRFVAPSVRQWNGLEFDETNRLFLAPLVSCFKWIEQKCDETSKRQRFIQKPGSHKAYHLPLPLRVFRMFRGPSPDAFVFVVLA